MKEIVYNSDSKTYSLNNNPTPTVPTISVSGGYGDNPTLTFSGGGGPNVDYYILKKDYRFNDGSNPIHFINPATSPYTDQNVEITFLGDLEVFYSVTAVGPTGIESNSSNTVSKDGQNQWKRAADSEEDEASIEYSLGENYPNPFNPTTEISYQIPKNSFVNLVVYNSLGQEVAELINQHQSSGKYSVQFNGNNLPSGVYVYKLQAGVFSSVKKMMLTK